MTKATQSPCSRKRNITRQVHSEAAGAPSVPFRTCRVPSRDRVSAELAADLGHLTPTLEDRTLHSAESRSTTKSKVSDNKCSFVKQLNDSIQSHASLITKTKVHNTISYSRSRVATCKTKRNSTVLLARSPFLTSITICSNMTIKAIN